MEGKCPTREAYVDAIEKKLGEIEAQVDQLEKHTVKVLGFLTGPVESKESPGSDSSAGWLPELLATLERLRHKLETVNRLQSNLVSEFETQIPTPTNR